MIETSLVTRRGGWGRSILAIGNEVFLPLQIAPNEQSTCSWGGRFAAPSAIVDKVRPNSRWGRRSGTVDLYYPQKDLNVKRLHSGDTGDALIASADVASMRRDHCRGVSTCGLVIRAADVGATGHFKRRGSTIRSYGSKPSLAYRNRFGPFRCRPNTASHSIGIPSALAIRASPVSPKYGFAALSDSCEGSLILSALLVSQFDRVAIARAFAAEEEPEDATRRATF